ncbi:unnamed protein product, partial [Mesorhabditis belari]|uniref:Phospholipase B1, membrane-associated n=1 Tax=Mesorhabditis belari TaxID=2138241 RepID=A0AAF3F483_9BILA
MRATLVCFLLALFSPGECVRSLGDPNYFCDAKLMAPSAKVPTNVNQLRPADITVIGAIGDSLTAANGAGAPKDPPDPLAIILQYRGLSFHAGGQLTLEEQITVPNILKKYNPNLKGYAVNTGSENVWEVAKLNGGIPGAKSLAGGQNLTAQAKALIQKMKAHPEIDIENDWKLLSIFIGGNDVCGWCSHPYPGPDSDVSPEGYAKGIYDAVQVFSQLPRTIVSLMGFMHMDLLRKIDNGQFFCQALHVFECHCEADNVSDADLRNVSISYQIEAQKIEDAHEFERDDFTFVIQPWFQNVDQLPQVKNESFLDFFAPDCFHFSQLGHSIVGHNLWNNMLQPVGSKDHWMDLGITEAHLSCPDPTCPFFRTYKNSQDCSQYMSPEPITASVIMKSFLLLALALTQTALADLKTLGAPGFTCDPKVMVPSAHVPTNVNQVRFADIKVIGAIGDSLTAANGAGAAPHDAIAVILQYRGLSFHAGGQVDLDEQITVPNIMKRFNPSIQGYAVGTGSENVWEVARLNGGVPGAESGDLKGQAESLITKMKNHPDIDFQNDWKLINLFIGGNDICAYCQDKIKNSSGTHSPEHFRDNIKAAVQVFKDKMPRTIVSMTGMFNMGMLRRVDRGQFFCDGLHTFECPCEADKNFTNADIDDVCQNYMKTQQQLQDTGVFEADDFTLVIQPFFNGVHTPPMADGKVDLTFFAPDCFHFSKFGHAVVAKNLWNTIVQPVGQKQTQVNLSDANPTLSCPSTTCPFVPTVKNSQNCAQFWTPSTLDA